MREEFRIHTLHQHVRIATPRNGTVRQIHRVSSGAGGLRLYVVVQQILIGRSSRHLDNSAGWNLIGRGLVGVVENVLIQVRL